MNFNIKDIAKTFKDSKKLGKPIIIFTGAGCSKSAGMPLASELINEMNKNCIENRILSSKTLFSIQNSYRISLELTV